ncbi:MAG TPA: hypothetical protein VK530_06985 [Candidatus Acidoferrum sp.]|nr:hypothetical protein [Candidatus Acidoferrum sp.]
MRVKIVLRDRSTGLYYRSERDWVRNGYDAKTFLNVLDAEAFCRSQGLTDLQFIQQQGYFFRPPEGTAQGNRPEVESAPN